MNAKKRNNEIGSTGKTVVSIEACLTYHVFHIEQNKEKGKNKKGKTLIERSINKDQKWQNCVNLISMMGKYKQDIFLMIQLGKRELHTANQHIPSPAA